MPSLLTEAIVLYSVLLRLDL